MAALDFSLSTGSLAVAAALTRIVAMLKAPANHRLRVKSIGLFGLDTTSTDTPIIWRLVRLSDDGTMTAAGLVKLDDSLPETIQTTGFKLHASAPVNPTVAEVLDEGTFHPQGGYKELMPWGTEYLVKGGGRIGLEVTTASAQAQTLRATLRAEE